MSQCMFGRWKLTGNRKVTVTTCSLLHRYWQERIWIFSRCKQTWDSHFHSCLWFLLSIHVLSATFSLPFHSSSLLFFSTPSECLPLAVSLSYLPQHTSAPFLPLSPSFCHHSPFTSIMFKFLPPQDNKHLSPHFLRRYFLPSPSRYCQRPPLFDFWEGVSV